MNFTKDAPITARVFLPLLVNNVLPVQISGSDTLINASTGFGLEFTFQQPHVGVDAFAGTVVTALQTALTAAFNEVAGQLLQGLTALTQPATDLNAVVINLTNAIPAVLQSTLVDAFSGLSARTGRLIYPKPAPGSSCEVSALLTVARAQTTIAPDGSIILQVAFDRSAISTPVAYPAFAPTGAADTGVVLSNTFVRDLLACLMEQFPNLSLPFLRGTVNGPPVWSATWPGVTLTVGPLAFTGTMTLAITGTPAGPGATPAPKAITLAFALAAAVGRAPVIPLTGIPLFPGSALTAALTFTLPIAFDLNGLASITALRLTGPAAPTPPALTTFAVGLGGGLITALTIAAIAIAASPFLGPVPIIWPGLLAIGILVFALPLIVTGILGGLLGNGINQVLGGLHRLLQSAAAIPPGIFEAFGKLVPTTMVVDDLTATGVLQTHRPRRGPFCLPS